MNHDLINHLMSVGRDVRLSLRGVPWTRSKFAAARNSPLFFVFDVVLLTFVALFPIP